MQIVFFCVDVKMGAVFQAGCNAMANTIVWTLVMRKIAISLVPLMNSSVQAIISAFQTYGLAMVSPDLSFTAPKSGSSLIFNLRFLRNFSLKRSGDSDCANGADEMNCTCDQNKFQCSDGRCIENRWRCGEFRCFFSLLSK